MTNLSDRSNRRDLERGWQRDGSPFHVGEQRVQTRIGVRSQIERAGRNMIHEQMPAQHRKLFEALPLLVVGSVDTSGNVWASLLGGPPGFIRSPSAKLLKIQALPPNGDPLIEQLEVGRPLGLLGIQLETRRRNRANGRVVARDPSSFSVEVEQSFGNCKQYIQAREPRFDPSRLGTADPPQVERRALSERARLLLQRTDTCFIATSSAHAAEGGEGEGVDVSHRGGRPGFVRVEPGPHGTRLTLPDFSGNFLFNSFGNLEVNPRAGVVCADFDTGDILSLSGSAQIIWEGPEVRAFPGAERLLVFEVEAARFLAHALPLSFHGLDPSPDLIETGTWPEAGPEHRVAPSTTD